MAHLGDLGEASRESINCAECCNVLTQLKWVLISMGIVLIPTTFFSYVPGLAQRGVMSGSGGCTAVARGDGPLAAKWTFALVNLVRPHNFDYWLFFKLLADFRHSGLCSRFHQANFEPTEWKQVRDPCIWLRTQVMNIRS